MPERVRLFLVTIIACAASLGVMRLLIPGADPPLPRGHLIPSEISGMWVSATVAPATHGFVIKAEVQNRRGAPVALEPDPCGHAAAARIVPTDYQSRGRTWDSPSVEELKGF